MGSPLQFHKKFQQKFQAFALDFFWPRPGIVLDGQSVQTILLMMFTSTIKRIGLTLFNNNNTMLVICLQQLGNKFAKYIILFLWRNEEYFSNLLGYN